MKESLKGLSIASPHRAGTDAKTDKEAQRSIENLALRSEGRVEEERMAIKRALSTWRVKPSKETAPFCF